MKKWTAGVSFTGTRKTKRAPYEGPLQEGLLKSGLVANCAGASFRSAYYGISASRYLEPLDQADAIMLCSRIRRCGGDINLTIFVAGRYAQLNGRDAEELIIAEDRKLEALRALGEALRMPIRLIRTADLWQEPSYWEAVERLSCLSGIISERRGAPFSSVASNLEPEILAAMPPALAERLGPVDAPALYRLFEVAEASYLGNAAGIDCKIGPASEEEYDVFIRPFMRTIQLAQPLDFRSTESRPKPLTPYIGKEGEERIFISDCKEAAEAKLFKLAQRSEGMPLFFGQYMNPFLRMSVLAVEAAALAESVPVRIAGARAYDGAGVAAAFGRAGMRSLAKVAPLISECLWAYLMRPVQRALDGGECS